MNGTRRLYRSKSDAMIGGVAAGIGNYFNVDPTLIRLAFLLLMLFSGGTFLLIYVLLWVLLPSVGSTAADSNQVVQENLEEIRARVRGFAGPNGGATNSGGAASQGNGSAETPTANGQAQAQAQAQPQLATGNSASTAQARMGANPMVLIGIGVFFLLVNLGFFRAIHWSIWWPLLLIGLGALILSRSQRR